MSEYIITDQQIKQLFNMKPITAKMERIVRCRDCAYSHVPIPLNGCRYCMLDSGCREIDPDGYCSLAEPKVDA